MTGDHATNTGVNIILDIETDTSDETDRERIRDEVTRDMEKKKKAVDAEDLDSLVEEAFRATALNADYGRLLCISLIAERGGRITAKRIFGYDKLTKKLVRNEEQMLSEFWHMLKDFNPGRDLIIGHNIFDFDLLFLYKRSIIMQIRPTVDLCFARYRSKPIYDTMREWEKWGRKSVGLGQLAGALGLQTSKTATIDGSKVYDHLRAGHDSEIAEYCYRDVVLTRQIFYRMNFLKSGDTAL